MTSYKELNFQVPFDIIDGLLYIFYHSFTLRRIARISPPQISLNRRSSQGNGTDMAHIEDRWPNLDILRNAFDFHHQGLTIRES